jgi:FAD:protein FMN transferase
MRVRNSLFPTQKKQEMSRKRNIAITLPVLILLLVALMVFGGKRKAAAYQHDSGLVFGTSYNITYQSAESHKTDIEKVLQGVDNSLSPFNESSIITAVNRNKNIELSDQFLEVYKLSQSVNAETYGAFDITVAPLVNAWGFGFKSGKMPSAKDIDSIRQFVGFDKVSLNDRHIVKKDSRTMLDCSAIAKGYGVDMVARYLAQEGIENYMVEIGGEIVVKGKNDSGKPWRIGVTKPTDDTLAVKQEIQTVLSLTDVAMATSGNYRNFYYKNGKKYAHTIDPKTGYPVQHNILSSTVIAKTCAKADAYATAFMVLGLDKAKEVLKRQKDIKAYFIYTDDNGKNAVWFSPELQKDILK